MGYLAGGYVFGTLSKGAWNGWLKAFMLVLPNLIIRTATFALAFYNTDLQQELLASKMTLIVIPALTMVLSPFVAYFGIGVGESYAEKYNRPKSVLNIDWYHWLWILPFYLFSVAGVTSFLLMGLWKYDSLTDSDSYFSIFYIFTSFPTIFFWLVILVVIGLVFFSIETVYSTLSNQTSKGSISVLVKVFFNWLFLTILESIILLSWMGQMKK
jgi:hypothetical protein